MWQLTMFYQDNIYNNRQTFIRVPINNNQQQLRIYHYVGVYYKECYYY